MRLESRSPWVARKKSVFSSPVNRSYKQAVTKLSIKKLPIHRHVYISIKVCENLQTLSPNPTQVSSKLLDMFSLFTHSLRVLWFVMGMF